MDLRALRNDRVTLVEKGSPQSLCLMESGKVPHISVTLFEWRTIFYLLIAFCLVNTGSRLPMVSFKITSQKYGLHAFVIGAELKYGVELYGNVVVHLRFIVSFLPPLNVYSQLPASIECLLSASCLHWMFIVTYAFWREKQQHKNVMSVTLILQLFCSLPSLFVCDICHCVESCLNLFCIAVVDE